MEKVEKAKDPTEKAREAVEKAREEVKQKRNDIGVIETEEAFRLEVSGVCRNYCLQIWNEALNQAGVKASSVLRKVKSVYYPSAIQASSSSNSKADTPPDVANPEKSNPNKFPPSSDIPPKVAGQPRVNGKKAVVTKGMAPDATKPPTAPQDPTKDKEAPKMEIVLVTLPLPAKVDPKGTDQGSSEAAVPKSKAPPQGKIVIKKK